MKTFYLKGKVKKIKTEIYIDYRYKKRLKTIIDVLASRNVCEVFQNIQIEKTSFQKILRSKNDIKKTLQTLK